MIEPGHFFKLVTVTKAVMDMQWAAFWIHFDALIQVLHICIIYVVHALFQSIYLQENASFEQVVECIVGNGLNCHIKLLIKECYLFLRPIQHMFEEARDSLNSQQLRLYKPYYIYLMHTLFIS